MDQDTELGAILIKAITYESCQTIDDFIIHQYNYGQENRNNRN